MIAIAQYFHYKIVETMPLEKLEDFKDHHRLQVFYHKGCKCVQCGIEGTQLAVGIGRNSTHIDVYTDDFYPLTVDHIQPKSLGGSDDLSNLQPMCCLCNWSKGNGINPARPNRSKYPSDKPLQQVQPQGIPFSRLHKHQVVLVTENTVKLGKKVYRRKDNNTYKLLGVITEITISPKTNEPSVKVADKPDSFFHIRSIYFKK